MRMKSNKKITHLLCLSLLAGALGLSLPEPVIYEDNVDRIPSRIAYAKEVVKNLVDSSGLYNFRTTKWNKAALGHRKTLSKNYME